MKKNLRDYRNETGLREQMSQFKELMDNVMQENEDLKERMEGICDEVRDELREELCEEYEEQLDDKDRQLVRLQKKLEANKAEINRLNAELEKLQHDEATRLEALRGLLGCTVNTFEGGSDNKIFLNQRAD